MRRKVQSYSQPSAEAVASDEKRAEANLVQFAEVERTLGSGDAAEIDAMIARLDREKTPGVNICPPVDFKPLAEDRFCARCEGFQECSARHMRATRKS